VDNDVQAMKHTPLARAARKNNVGMIEFLVHHGAQNDRSGGLNLTAEYGSL